MRFNILPCAFAVLSVVLSACNSSDSKDSNPTSAGGLERTGFDDKFNGIANGSITVAGKVIPIEFGGRAYQTRVNLVGYSDLANQDTGWIVAFGGKTTTTSPQNINQGYYEAVVTYRIQWDSAQCMYTSEVGTITIDSFAAKKSDTKSFFRTSGNASCTLVYDPDYSLSDDCPDLSFKAAFSQVDVTDDGLNQ